MNKEYLLRRKKAKELNTKLKDLCIGIVLIGSVAYSSKKVTKKSDLDILLITKFKKMNFKEFYKRINQTYESKVINDAIKTKFNIFSVVYEEEFEIGLHIWDIKAFNNVINLTEKNILFRRNEISKNYPKVSKYRTFRNISGKEIKLKKVYKKINSGKTIEFSAFIEKDHEFYPDVQLTNLLLNPIILSENKKIIKKGIEKMRKNLQIKLNKMYPQKNKKELDLFNALPDRIKEKIDLNLKKKLRF
ncbi:hypothetical protein GW932_02265 [archaeon]|nr:hypothetical protein [archaeon]